MCWGISILRYSKPVFLVPVCVPIPVLESSAGGGREGWGKPLQAHSTFESRI